ncbi:MAG: dNTP triphosphohydrolase, partial [Oscillospiraceae bacterium]
MPAEKRSIRELTEEIEQRTLSEFAALSVNSMGRVVAELPCELRTAYQRDRDRIIHCKSFRRLMHKTQVFLSPEGDHYRTRLTHTLEVAQIARTIARALRLNEDLTEAAALAHDLGHTPFGHAGERTLNTLMPNGFRHYEHSVRVVEYLEKNGSGLNLTKEVKDGILHHTNGKEAATMEGRIIRWADRIAYIN